MKKRNGFTLIEIIISIALLVLIASYGLFKYAEVQEASKQQLDLAAVGTFVEAVEMLRINDPAAAKKTEIKSDDPGLQRYLSGKLEGKSKEYGGPFVATYDDKGKLTVKSSGGKTLYPELEGGGNNSTEG
ncbi:MAG: type II secretion system protein [Filifactor alocis]|nr:type II secretion system protein [Filifactor alocis]